MKIYVLRVSFNDGSFQETSHSSYEEANSQAMKYIDSSYRNVLIYSENV